MDIGQLQGVENARDLGGIPAGGGRSVVPGKLYRGGALARATDRDVAVLFDELGIGCVVDVRCGWERDEKPDVVVPGVRNVHIPFYDLEIVGVDYTRPAEGTKPIGNDFACEPIDFYRSLANPATVGQMRQAVHTVFDCVLDGIPVYIHCSGGKDRAGITSLLVLTILGASRDDILADYLKTNESRYRNYDKFFNRFLRFVDGDEERALELTRAHDARPENLAAFYGAIEENYGGMAPFVREQLAFDDGRVELVRDACTA